MLARARSQFPVIKLLKAFRIIAIDMRFNRWLNASFANHNIRSDSSQRTPHIIRQNSPNIDLENKWQYLHIDAMSIYMLSINFDSILWPIYLNPWLW